MYMYKQITPSLEKYKYWLDFAPYVFLLFSSQIDKDALSSNTLSERNSGQSSTELYK